MRAISGLIGESLALQPAGPRTGSVDHIAFRGTDRQAVMQKLEALKIAYRYNAVPGGQLHQLFVRDPDDVILELNFPS
jgi:hypothetical protein